MDGKTALGFVRFRHDALVISGGWRGSRSFMMTVFHKIKDPAMITKIPGVDPPGIRLVKTNLTLRRQFNSPLT